MEIEGRPSVVTVRGKVQVRDGKFVGEARAREPVALEAATIAASSSKDCST